MRQLSLPRLRRAAGRARLWAACLALGYGLPALAPPASDGGATSFSGTSVNGGPGCGARTAAQVVRGAAEPAPALLGESASTRETRDLIARVAPLDTTVIILGEIGTGKEVVARSLHQQSRRKDGPFIALNCAGLSESLVESELFGHEKGAFTGATERKPGKLELANKGTLFLDEFGELPKSLQPKLLRVLEGHPFERLGGRETIRPDFRLVVATNRNLEEMVREGKFRSDLYFRVFTYPIQLAPLRDRREDIPILARHFLEMERAVMLGAGENDRPLAEAFSDEAMAKMRGMRWPGNVRELRNAVTRALIYATTPEIPADAIIGSRLADPEAVDRDSGVVAEAVALSAMADSGEWMPSSQAELRLLGAYYQAAVDRLGSQTAAAEKLEISRGTLRKVLEEYRRLVLSERSASP